MATLINSGVGTWTVRTTPTLAYPSVAANATAAVAVSYSGDTSPVLRSTNGTAWTQTAAGTAAQLWNDVIWVDAWTLFVAVSDASGTGNNVMTSPTGETWTLRAATDEAWIAVAYSPSLDKAVAVSYSAPTNVLVCTNAGVTWNSVATTGLAAAVSDIAWDAVNSVFVGVTIDGIYTSADGVTWALSTTALAVTGNANGFVSKVAVGAGVIVVPVQATAVVDQTGVVRSDDGGATWTLVTFSGSMAEFMGNGITYGNGLFVMVDSDGNIMAQTGSAFSSDGTTWTPRAMSFFGDWYDVCWADGFDNYVAVAIEAATTDNLATAPYSAVPQVTGLDHLEGETVGVIADDVVIASPNNDAYDPIVVTGGTVTLPAGSYTRVVVGLPYTTDIQTLDIDTVSSTVKDRGMQVGGVICWVEDSGQFYAGPRVPATDGLTGLEAFVPTNEEGYATTGTVTGVAEVTLQATYNNTGRVLIRQVDPVPLTILSIAPTGFLNGGR